MTEKEIISIVHNELPSGRLCPVFSSDAEPVAMTAGEYLLSIDEFSEEDRFNEKDFYALGWNAAAGTISDILACGGRPLHYVHSLTAGMSWTKKNIALLARGMGDALRKSGTVSVGGDCGKASQWRITGTITGSVEGRRLGRIGCKPGDAIYMTGPAGAGNFQAALSLLPQGDKRFPFARAYAFKVPLRLHESRYIREFATACMDTSDGVLSAVNTLADLNSCGYELTGIPYFRPGLLLAAFMKIPPILLLAGGCGEYELLFTIKNKTEKEFIDGWKQGRRFFRKIGVVADSGRYIRDRKIRYDMSTLTIEARDFDSLSAYIDEITGWARRQERDS